MEVTATNFVNRFLVVIQANLNHRYLNYLDFQAMKLKKTQHSIFDKTKPHAAQGFEIKSASYVINNNPTTLALKVFGTWKPIIFVKVNLKLVFFDILLFFFDISCFSSFLWIKWKIKFVIINSMLCFHFLRVNNFFDDHK